MAIANSASVSAISLRYILPSPGYAPGTITINVTWMKRGFNAGQTHNSMYPSIHNRLRAIARFWSEIATLFVFPLHLKPPLGVLTLEFREKYGPQKTRIMKLPGSEDSLMTGWAVFDTIPASDGRTDVQPIAITCVSLLKSCAAAITSQQQFVLCVVHKE